MTVATRLPIACSHGCRYPCAHLEIEEDGTTYLVVRQKHSGESHYTRIAWPAIVTPMPQSEPQGMAT